MRSTEHNNLVSNLKGLHSGAAAGNLGLVKFALDHGQPIDSVLNGVLPIHFACINDHVAVVQYLIERGADVNAPRPPLGTEKNRTTDQTIGATGSTALHFAAANGCTQTVELLLKNGAIVDVADKYGSTPLSVAIAKNHADVVELLKTYGAIQAAEKQKIVQDDSIYTKSTSNLKYPKRPKEKSSKIVKKTKKPALIATKFPRTRRPSLPFEFEKNESMENVILKRQPSKSMELPPPHLKLREEISKDDGFISDSMTIDSFDKPSLDMSYYSLDESDVKKLKSPTKELFRKSLTLSRQLTSTSLTSLASSNKSRSSDRRFSFSSSPVTPQSNPSAISLLMTPPDIPGSPSTTSTAPTEYGGDPDYISLPPVITEKKKRRSTDPLYELKTRKWNNNETNDDGTMSRSMSEGSGVNFFFTPNKKQQISSENFRSVENNSNNKKASFTMKGLFGKLTDLILGKS